ncbi:type II toxin-antitoxin system RelE/ParE family toxin [Patescibacteria group bacterium]|nr:type II toxin-antitoxin system RelE/ParE family toxin [Patescibacteria group bacterium]MBU1885060.1 type II toxin-antitoxin system RelE/ParE family toxin [Patescibacteria group bacterium]
MSYRLLYTKRAVKDIQKLDTVVKKRIGKKLSQYARDPMTYARKLVNASIGTYRWRIGDYRVVFDVDREKIVVLRVGHRSEIY